MSILAICRRPWALPQPAAYYRARGSRVLPLVSVNVHDADVDFFRVHDDARSDLFCAYPGNKHRDSYDLDHELSSYNQCNKDTQQRRPITAMADSVYANYYTLDGKENERAITYLAVQNVKPLAAPGVYMAVVKHGGTFSNGYETAMFFLLAVSACACACIATMRCTSINSATRSAQPVMPKKKTY